MEIVPSQLVALLTQVFFVSFFTYTIKFVKLLQIDFLSFLGKFYIGYFHVYPVADTKGSML